MPEEIIKQITGIVFSVTLKKSGITNKRNWTIYEVIIGGETFSTFDAGYKELIGKEGTFNYVEKQNTSTDGRVFTNKTLQAVPKPEAPPENVGLAQPPQPMQPGYETKTIQISEVVVNTLLSNQAKIIKLLTPNVPPNIPHEEIPTVEEDPPPPEFS